MIRPFRHTIRPIKPPLKPPFYEATIAEAGMALRLAQESFDAFRSRSPEDRAQLLDAIADQIMALGDELLERAHQETGLPMPRLTGERARAVNQAKLFAELIREGSWVDARIDTAIPDRQPLPKPDVRRMLMPIGPVVVFGLATFHWPFPWSAPIPWQLWCRLPRRGERASWAPGGVRTSGSSRPGSH